MSFVVHKSVAGEILIPKVIFTEMLWTYVKAGKVLKFSNAYFMTRWYLHGGKQTNNQTKQPNIHGAGAALFLSRIFESFALKTKGERRDSLFFALPP